MNVRALRVFDLLDPWSLHISPSSFYWCVGYMVRCTASSLVPILPGIHSYLVAEISPLYDCKSQTSRRCVFLLPVLCSGWASRFGRHGPAGGWDTLECVVSDCTCALGSFASQSTAVQTPLSLISEGSRELVHLINVNRSGFFFFRTWHSVLE